MTWYPMAFLPPQYVDSSGDNYSGAVLKAYQAGTTTPILMATNSDGTTVATSFALNAAGYPVSGGAVIIPHIQEDYKISLYPDQASADADSGAIWTYDDVKIADVAGSAFVETFSGDGTTTSFTLSEGMGTEEKVLMVFADKKMENYAVNGSFATDSDWTKGTGWTIGSGVATATGAISTDIYQTPGLVLQSGEAYTLIFTLTVSAGGLIPKIGGVAGIEQTGSGTHRVQIAAGATQEIKFTGNGFTGTIDGVELYRTSNSQRQILRPDEFTLNGTSLVFDEAPAAGTDNILVFAPASLFGTVGNLAADAAISEANAAQSAIDAAASAQEAEDWAVLAGGISVPDGSITYSKLDASVGERLGSLYSPMQCRVERTSSTTIKLSRHNGKYITLYNTATSVWQLVEIPSSGVTFTLTAETASTLWWIVANYNGTNINFTLTSTAPATDSTTGRFLVGTGLTVLGMLYTDGGIGQVDNDNMVMNYFNRKMRNFENFLGSNTSTSSTSSVEVSSALRTPFLIWGDEELDVTFISGMNSNAGGIQSYSLVTLDGIVTEVVRERYVNRESYNLPLWKCDREITSGISEGYHYLTVAYNTSNATYPTTAYAKTGIIAITRG